LFALGAAVVSLLTPSVAQRMHHAELDLPGMVIWDARMITTMAQSGEPLRYSFAYAKRPECHPPRGEGEVYHRLWSRDPSSGAYRSFHVVDHVPMRAPPIDHGYRTVTIDPPSLPDGQYALQFRASYRCERSSARTVLDGPMLAFSIKN
jgi:hypothetical protein